MKIKALFFAVLVSFFFFSCDSMMFTGYQGGRGIQGDQGDPGDKGPTGDPGGTPVITPDGPEIDPFAFVYLTGERYEKYYFWPDPVDPDKTVDLNYKSQPGSFWSTEVTVHNFPVLNLINSTEAAVKISGGIPIPYDRFNFLGNWMDSGMTTGGFEGTISLTPDSYVPAEIDEFFILNSFTSDLSDFSSLSFPKTGNYSSKVKYRRDVTFSFFIPKEVMNDLYNKKPLTSAPNSIGGDDYFGNAFYTVNAYPSTTFKNEQHSLKSRNFYEYKSIEVSYPPGSSLSGVFPSPIVKNWDYDAEANSLTVVFNDYNSPYSGDVISYIIVDNSTGNSRSKTIKIVD